MDKPPETAGAQSLRRSLQLLRLLASGQLDVRPLISRVAGLGDWRSCFEGMAEGSLLKAVLKP